MNHVTPVTPLDYAAIRDEYCAQLIQSSRGDTTSLPFIHNRLPASALVQPGEVFRVFVIGGTNGETATVQYEADGTIRVLSHERHPELAKFHTVEDFLSFVDSQVDVTTRAIGLNFGFTLIPAVGRQGQLDGVMVSGETKGHAFDGLQKEKVGAAIEAHFWKTHQRTLIASVGNDTVCLIASVAARGVNRDTLMAGIVGTGYNMAFFLDEHTIVNVQASDFTGFEPSATGRVVDAESTNVGEQLFNKEVAAGELYKHYNVLAQNGEVAEPVQSSKELAALAETRAGKDGEVARALFARSASLVAAQFAGFYEFKGRPRQLLAVMQGGLFWDGPNYKAMVTEEIERLGVPSGAIAFKKLEQADILGAAKLITGGL